MSGKTRWLQALWLTLITACGQSAPRVVDAGVTESVPDTGVITAVDVDAGLPSDARAQLPDASEVADASVGADANDGVDRDAVVSVNDAGTDAANSVTDASVDTSCDGVVDGTIQTRVRYASTSASSAALCQFEVQVRNCQTGSWSTWSGSYEHAQCAVTGLASCGDKPHGWIDVRIRYANATPSYPFNCEAQEQRRACNDGNWSTWTGTSAYAFDTCTVQYPGCGALAHGQSESRSRFADDIVPYGESCVSQTQTRLCAYGVLQSWVGSYAYESCEVALPADCGAVVHGAVETRTRYAEATVASDAYANCKAEDQSRSCINGAFTAWSGTYGEPKCQVLAGGSCYFPDDCASGICTDRVCGCPDKWQGQRCDECAAHATEDCSSCTNGWQGSACDRCPANFSGANCNVCANQWQGSACDQCPAHFDAASGCKSCALGWSGANCEVFEYCVRYVRAGTLVTADGQHWSSAFSQMQRAIEAAAKVVSDNPGVVDHCEVWVSADTYYTYSNVQDPVKLQPGVHVYGGFVGSETLRAQRNFATNATVIAAEYNPGSPVLGADDAVLDGFTIRNSIGSGLKNAGTSPLVRNCIFDGNTSEVGGAVYNTGGHPKFEHCTFRNNEGRNGSGGAIFQSDGDLTISDSVFVGNEAAGRGGAIYIAGGELWLTDSSFTSNFSYGDDGGGAIYGEDMTISRSSFIRNRTFWLDGAWGGAVYAKTLQLHDSTFIGNNAQDGWGNGRVARGGAVYCTSANITGSTFYANKASFEYTGGSVSQGGTRGGAVAGGFVVASNDIFWGNVADVGAQIDATQLQASYSDVEGGAPGMGNLDVDPLFVDADADDVSLQAASMCIGAADGGGDMGAIQFGP